MKITKTYSLFALLTVFVVQVFATFFYYPKWKNPGTEAVISYDVAGYYQYLPATFIYNDLKDVGYIEELNAKYRFSPNNDLALPLPGGNKVFKYAMGQAMMLSPFFAAGHLYARNSEYPADGFSKPYQLALEFGILFYALIGLIFLRSILLNYFNDQVVALTLVSIGLATNYLEYTSMTGAMTHNTLFAVYALLIYLTIAFYRQKTFTIAVSIGILLGLAALTRPTEIIAMTIPFFWGVSTPVMGELRRRIQYISNNRKYFILMLLSAASIGIWQIVYWKYVSGDFLVYSYGEEGFQFLDPNIMDCLFSYKAGWLVYSPIMIVALVGFYFLYRQHRKLLSVTLFFSLIAMYIVFSWETWWYGGSLGQRALIQYYPVLAFPFASTVQFLIKRSILKALFGLFLLTMIYYNFWLTHQAHKGGLLIIPHMTKAYFWKVIGKYEQNTDDLKLLDTEEYVNSRRNIEQLYYTDFEDVEVPRCHPKPIQGSNSYCLSDLDPVSRPFSVPLEYGSAEWVRVTATLFIEYKVWNVWTMGMLKVRFMSVDRIVKEKFIRVHRMLEPGKSRQIFLDVKCPDEKFDHVVVEIDRGGAGNMLIFDQVLIESFDE